METRAPIQELAAQRLYPDGAPAQSREALFEGLRHQTGGAGVAQCDPRSGVTARLPALFYHLMAQGCQTQPLGRSYGTPAALRPTSCPSRLNTRPSFMTNRTFCSIWMLSRGLPCTPTMSARFP